MHQAIEVFAIKEKHFFKKSNKQTKNPQNKTNRDSIILPLILTALFMLISALPIYAATKIICITCVVQFKGKISF